MSIVSREDYQESCCSRDAGQSIPLGRVLDKLDFYLDRKDFDACARHLDYWVREAEACGDTRGKLALLNERIGFCRMSGRRDEGLVAIADAIALAESLELGDSAVMGTTCVNAATAYRAFGRPDDALTLYEKAAGLYRDLDGKTDERPAGLYNNMAVTLCDLGRYGDAEASYRRALEYVTAQEHGEGRAAVTWLNMADLYRKMYGPEDENGKIAACIERAESLLNTKSLPRDRDYAFICEKCAPVFGEYGYFAAEAELTQRAKDIYGTTV